MGIGNTSLLKEVIRQVIRRLVLLEQKLKCRSDTQIKRSTNGVNR